MGTSSGCPHFHIPLQSGDDSILNRMKRNYTVADYVNIIQTIKTQIPHAGLGTDIIVGFPEETQNHFSNTYNLIKELPFSYLHVFSFSPRPNTEAAKLSDTVHPQIKKSRSYQLRELGKEKKRQFYRQAISSRFNVLFEEKANGKWMYGFSENYIRIKTQKNQSFYNTIVPVVIQNIQENFALGEIII